MKFFYSLLGLGLLAEAGFAQNLANNGSILTVQSGATLYIPGALDNKAGSTLTNTGVVQVLGNLTNAGTLNSSGRVLLSGSAAQTLTAGGAALAQLEVNNGSSQGLTVPDNLTITQELKLTNGMVRTPASATISLTNTASVSGEATGRYVQGNLRVTRDNVSTATDFTNSATIGGNGQNLGRVEVTRTAGLTLAGTSYGTFGDSKSVDRIWTVTADQAPTGAVPITLSWLPDNDNGLTDFSRVLIWRQATQTAPWNGVGSVANASTTRSISSSTTVLGRFTVTNSANPLPVQLIAFRAEARAADVLLHWATASEKDNALFAIEVSTDGRLFQTVGQVAGRGTTSQQTSYTYTDARVSRYNADVLYYRLRQQDTDGTQSYSAVQVVRPLETEQAMALQAHPNPFSQELFARLVLPKAGLASIALHNTLGQVLFTRQLELPAGTSEVALPEADKLPQGVYLLVVRQANASRVVKVVRE
ncbi:T9SS type A sorting domain-containing protein [Hymenobacter taeanensis]|uniref:T9SS type A sorting domain-containing protein n=1 Tax=Hymenobacter taeanensis TaxID=2735321 RepID=A0A6M6BFM6_9BACT|nr:MULTISPECIES: T9SS type A sorting domain-containing protein [Hymenobacter]QJX46779.1 T9SS type A sorting domain-containing protein [Hymenobacter taeanensis]UOQ80648.1 T9SS type A sorting domain-containing protein [Hymenobacter sp. 5414T-23]